jgi:hypothetical protein
MLFNSVAFLFLSSSIREQESIYRQSHSREVAGPEKTAANTISRHKRREKFRRPILIHVAICALE